MLHGYLNQIIALSGDIKDSASSFTLGVSFPK